MEGSESEENIFEKRADTAAMRIHERNRIELIRFYEGLADADRGPVPKALRDEDDSSVSIAMAEKAYNEALESLSGRIQSLKPEEAGLAVARLCIGRFMVERLRKLREIVHKRGTLGSFSLYATMRERLGSDFSARFYFSTQDEMIGRWLDNEPLLSACSSLHGLAVPSPQEIIAEYQPRVADDMSRFDK